MKKSKLRNKIQILEDVEHLLIVENSNLHLLINALRNISVDVAEKRFRTIQRTVSKLQLDIKEKDNTIKNLLKDKKQ